MRRFWMGCLLGVLMTLSVHAQSGIPFFVNYAAKDYAAHNRNFDVVCDSSGVAYFANFEGILFYNGSRWGRILTPGISRITRLHVDRRGEVWAGGLNYIGRVGASAIGTPQLISLLSDEEGVSNALRIGEVNAIEERGDTLFFRSSQYEVTILGDSLLSIQSNPYPQSEATTVRTVCTETGWEITAEPGGGLKVRNSNLSESFSIHEANGLCSDQVNALAMDADGSLWGATDQGIFRISFPSFFSRFTGTEGLRGEVTSVARYDAHLYVGTLHGLYRLNEHDKRFESIPVVQQACWQLVESPTHELYAATSNGLFRIHSRQRIETISDNQTFSVAFEADGTACYTGELDGVYRMDRQTRSKIANVEKSMKLELFQGALWTETLAGEIYRIDERAGAVQLIDSLQGLKTVGGNKLYAVDGKLRVLNAQGFLQWNGKRFEREENPLDSLIAKSLWWPSLLAKEPHQSTFWIANGEGKELKVLTDGKLDQRKTGMLQPLSDYLIRVLYLEPEGVVWLGGDFGLVHIDPQQPDASYRYQPDVHIRRIQLNKEELYFDGQHAELTQFDLGPAVFQSDTKELTFFFSSGANDVLYPTQYSYYLEGYEPTWRAWSEESLKEYTNLWYGTYTFHVKAKDAFGRESPEETFTFTILIPFYLKWYSLLLYLMLFVLLLVAIFRYRTQRLLKEKLRLEEIVAQRTQEIVEQRDEIVEKSEKLEVALRELKEAQEQLIRQEKVATVGKLTQGLIDRILNPLNYIINFSHLSSSLLKDMREDVEDEQEQISEDNYEDMQEILDMLNTHLTKIEEHGQSTSRILKAMEELLSDQGCHFKPIDVNHLLTENLAVLREYDRKLIETHQIEIQFAPLSPSCTIDADPAQLGKAIVSILHNGIYALAKKRTQMVFEPCLSVVLELQEDHLLIHVRDNGIGIELNIRHKIFDPFFTTKTTAEAAGVGLYLCREVILSHNGQIDVHSEKNEYTEFIVTLPIHQSTKSNSYV